MVEWLEECGSVRGFSRTLSCSSIRVLFEREKAVRRFVEGNNRSEIARRYSEWRQLTQL